MGPTNKNILLGILSNEKPKYRIVTLFSEHFIIDFNFTKLH